MGVAAVFGKAEFFVQGNGAGVVGDNVQFQLGVAGFARAVDAGGGECLANAKAPEFLSDADAELGAVPLRRQQDALFFSWMIWW